MFREPIELPVECITSQGIKHITTELILDMRYITSFLFSSK
ncbi:hypothetical protein MXB_4490 [Myxobolus squamalis]|nr:hypothetical protein MXB_4490 [Myxobolus squamalis]